MFKITNGWEVLSVIGILIAAYLILNNGWNFTQILKTGGGVLNDTITNLQGRG